MKHLFSTRSHYLCTLGIQGTSEKMEPGAIFFCTPQIGKGRADPLLWHEHAKISEQSFPLESPLFVIHDNNLLLWIQKIHTDFLKHKNLSTTLNTLDHRVIGEKTIIDRTCTWDNLQLKEQTILATLHTNWFKKILSTNDVFLPDTCESAFQEIDDHLRSCCIREVLARAVAQGGSSLKDFVSAEGQTGYFQLEASVYGRAKLPCRVCQTPIKQIVQGQRSTFFCPLCQKH